jgi:serine/threonine protein kinase
MPEPLHCPQCGAPLTPGRSQSLCPSCALKGALEFSGDDTEPVSPSPPIPEAGERIGRYKLLEKIGEGGCGIVYMAEQEEPVRRRVALKVIKPGMDTREVIARFEAERQALALMDHPHIARIFDGGVIGDPHSQLLAHPMGESGRRPGEGIPPLASPSLLASSARPYFVMELVRGLRITDYCDQKNLSTRQRLDLFMQVCQAVQHAHQKGIIHRDLKPSNILVTVNDGVPVPKVIDFGIAKATGQRLTDKTFFTKFQQLIGTPAYMSPEQAEMTSVDIDTRSDIYSLGVLLYELLTGRTPFDTNDLLRAGMEEMLRTIRKQEPARPSARLSTLAANEQTTVAQQRQTEAPKLMQLLRGDLDGIAMKCLEKDRARRYETANGLAADVHRHLTNEPVLARPPGNLYRFRKTVRRHKLAFAAAGAVLASLILGLAATTIMFFKEQAALGGEKAARAQVAQQKSEVERKKAEVERKNAEFRAMLVEAARSDRFVAEEKLRSGHEQSAFAHLARACDYDPSSTLAAELAFSILGSWNHELPVAILTGHEKGVQSAQFSPDGKRIVTASADKTARVWDAATGKTLATLAGHEQAVYSAQFSPDGTRLVTRSADWTARVWDAATGKALATITGHTNVVWSAQFSPDGTRLVTASADKTAWLWDALPKSAGPPPEWFPDFLRYMAQMRLNSDGELETLKPADWLALRERLRGVLRANANAETPYLRILRKYVRG